MHLSSGNEVADMRLQRFNARIKVDFNAKPESMLPCGWQDRHLGLLNLKVGNVLSKTEHNGANAQ